MASGLRSTRALTEEQKRFAELLLRSGQPMTEIANQLGVNRATLYKWLQDPTWQAYYKQLLLDVEVARVNRMLPVSMAAMDLAQAALNQATEQIRTNSPDAPSITQVAEVLRKVHDVERSDRTGASRRLPASAGEQPAADVATPNMERIMGALDAALAGEGPGPDEPEH